jgi:hypothetical protein
VKLNIREKFSTEKRLFPENAHRQLSIGPSQVFACLHFAAVVAEPSARFSLKQTRFSGFL